MSKQKAKTTAASKRLHTVAASSDYAELGNLIKFGHGDIEFRDVASGGTRPLHVAAKHNRPQNITLLVNAGASINCKDMDGWTPLHYACTEGHLDSVIVLEQAGANMNIVNRDGNTPLAYAVSRGHSALVEHLLNNDNVDPSIKNKKGEEAEDYAQEFNQPELAQRLKDHKDLKFSKFRKVRQVLQLTMPVRRAQSNGFLSTSSPTSPRHPEAQRMSTEPIRVESPFGSPCGSGFVTPVSVLSGSNTPDMSRSGTPELSSPYTHSPSSSTPREVSPVGMPTEPAYGSPQLGRLSPILSREGSFEENIDQAESRNNRDILKNRFKAFAPSNVDVNMRGPRTESDSGLESERSFSFGMPNTPSSSSQWNESFGELSLDDMPKSPARFAREDERELPKKSLDSTGSVIEIGETTISVQVYQDRLRRLEKNIRQEMQDALEEKEKEIQEWKKNYYELKRYTEKIVHERNKINRKLQGFISLAQAEE